MPEHPGNLGAREEDTGMLETCREPGTGILGLVPSTARKPQSFSLKGNFDLGPHKVLGVPEPQLGWMKSHCPFRAPPDLCARSGIHPGSDLMDLRGH